MMTRFMCGMPSNRLIHANDVDCAGLTGCLTYRIGSDGLLLQFQASIDGNRGSSGAVRVKLRQVTAAPIRKLRAAGAGHYALSAKTC